MSVKFPPIKHRDFERVLEDLGFEKQPRKSTSHERWKGVYKKETRNVTLDKHNSPYHRQVLSLMLHQLGMTKSEFYDLLDPAGKKDSDIDQDPGMA